MQFLDDYCFVTPRGDIERLVVRRPALVKILVEAKKQVAKYFRRPIMHLMLRKKTGDRLFILIEDQRGTVDQALDSLIELDGWWLTSVVSKVGTVIRIDLMDFACFL
jgi:hypothetical protein